MKARAADILLFLGFFILVGLCFYLASFWGEKELVYKLIYEGL